MMIKKLTAALLSAAIMICAAGCSVNISVQMPDNASKESTPAADVKEPESPGPGTVPVLQENADGQEEAALSGSNDENSVLLFDLLSKDGANHMISPLSLNYALGLLAAGTGGATKAQLDAYLCTDDYGKAAREYMERAAGLNSEKETFFGKYSEALEIANSLWINSRICTLKEGYVKKAADDFDAMIESPDFGDIPAVVKKVNDWCSEKTHGLIPYVLSDDMVTDDTAAILANSLYFESPWAVPWALLGDPSEKFVCADGTRADADFIDTEGADRYFENDKATAFSCMYTDGLEFIGILPKKEGAFTLSELDIPELIKEHEKRFDKLYVKMPRLDFENSYDLKKALPALGVTDIFSVGADFSAFADGSFYISEAVQKTKIELDENGTRAAAVTVMVSESASLPPAPEVIKEVLLTRPFAFLIYDREFDRILFLGKVNSAGR